MDLSKSGFDYLDRRGLPHTVQHDGAAYIRVNDSIGPVVVDGDKSPLPLLTRWHVFFLSMAIALLVLLVATVVLASGVLSGVQLQGHFRRIRGDLAESQSRLEYEFQVEQVETALANIQILLGMVHVDIPIALSEVHAMSLLVNSTVCYPD